MRYCAIKQALLSSAGLFALVFANSAIANPLSATVTTGSASVASSATKTQIDQKSEDVVIDWSSFNIGAGQTTQFVQPNAQAIAVNRIGGSAPSQILGTLDANGRIVLIKSNGMLFGKDSYQPARFVTRLGFQNSANSDSRWRTREVRHGARDWASERF
jgi:filamentous hemagglutinin family protein